MANSSRESLPARVEQRIQMQQAIAARLREAAAPPPALTLPFLTLSRQYGCEAVTLADELAARLRVIEGETEPPWQVYSKQIIEALAQQKVQLSPAVLDALDRTSRGGMQEFFETLFGRSSPDIAVLRHLVRTLRAIALLGHAIIVGRGGAVLTSDLPGGIHVRLIAPEAWRLESLVTRFGWDRARALLTLREEEQHRITFFEKYLGRNVNDPAQYDLVLNVARLSREEQAEAILALYATRAAAREPRP